MPYSTTWTTEAVCQTKSKQDRNEIKQGEKNEIENPEVLHFKFKSHAFVNKISQRNADWRDFLQVKQFANPGNAASAPSGNSK